jgi:hypothetical protein
LRSSWRHQRRNQRRRHHRRGDARVIEAHRRRQRPEGGEHRQRDIYRYLDAAYPARAAREMGWMHTPLLCMQEMAVVGSLPRCIRVLVLWNTERPPDQVRHVYLGKARALRPDLVEEGTSFSSPE